MIDAERYNFYERVEVTKKNEVKGTGEILNHATVAKWVYY